MFLMQIDAGLIEILVAIAVIAFLVVVKGIEKAGKALKQGQGSAPVGQSEPAKRPEMVPEMRRFFEELRRRQGAQSAPVRQKPVVVPVEQEKEGGEGPQGDTLAKRMEGVEQKKMGQLEVTLQPKVAPTAERGISPLERVLNNPNLSPGARAVVLMQLMGPPTSMRGYDVDATWSKGF